MTTHCDVDGAPVAMLRSSGTQDLPTVVLLHGAGCNHNFFANLVGELESARSGLDVVAPSFPGRCGSTGRALQEVGAMARWLATLLAELDLRRVVVGGHSMGGAVALELALHPELVPPHIEIAGLVLLATGGRLRVSPAIFAAMRQAVADGQINDVGRFAYHPTSAPEVVDAAEAERAVTPPEAALADWYAANRFDRLDRLGGIQTPAMVVGGRDDPFTPVRYSEYLQAHMQNAELHILEAAGHMFPVERSRDLAPMLVDFAMRCGRTAR